MSALCDCDESTGPAVHRGRRVCCAACGYRSHAWHGNVVETPSGRYVVVSEAQGFEPEPDAPGEAEWSWSAGTRGGSVRVTRCCMAPAARRRTLPGGPRA